MGDNVIVSFDEEKLMNDILDQGIDELKKSNPHTKSNSFNKTYTSNPDYNPKNDLIQNKKFANLNKNSNGSNENNVFYPNYNSERLERNSIDFSKDMYPNQTERVETNFNPEAINKINQIKNYIKEGIESKSKEEFNTKNLSSQPEIGMGNFAKINNKDLNVNKNYEYKSIRNTNSNGNYHKKNLAELKNNYSLPNDDNNFSNINNYNIPNTLGNNKISNLNSNEFSQLSQDKGLGTFKNQEAAEGQLISNDDTMQIIHNQSLKNNLLNSNNSNTKSRGEGQVAKSSALRALLDEMKSKSAYLIESNENVLLNSNTKNFTTRTENPNSSIGFGNNLILNNHYNGEEISKTARMNNFLSNDLTMNNNNNIINDSSVNFANILNSNSNRVRNISIDSVNSNADLNFDDMKNEIDNLQSKIDGLEKKLFENTSSKESFDVNFNSQTALDGIKRTSEHLNISKSSIKRSTSKNKFSKLSKYQSSPKSHNDSFTLKSKHIISPNIDSNESSKKANKLTQQAKHKHSYSNNLGVQPEEDLNYRKKYNSKLNLKSKYALLFDSDGVRNIETSQELSPAAADRSHYKTPALAAKNNLIGVGVKEKEEKIDQSMCSKHSKNSKNSKANFAPSFISNSNPNTQKAKNPYAGRLNYSKGVYEENVLCRSKASSNHNQSILSDANNKSCEDREKFTSKRVVDIIKKTQSILGRSASRETGTKGKITKNSVLTVLKKDKDKVSVADYSNCSSDAEKENDSNSNNNYKYKYNKDYSDNEIKPKGFNTDLITSNSNEKKRKKKLSSKVKSKSKSKTHISRAKSDFNTDSLLTFTNNDNINNSKLINCEAASRISGRKAKKSAAAANSSVYAFNRVNTGSNRSFSINMHGNKSKIAEQKDKEKILKLKERNNELKLSLKSERKKNDELEKKMKKIKFKEENFDVLEKNFISLQKEFERMQKSYNQSELIRKEQAKLIKSMKYEIELLKEGR